MSQINLEPVISWLENGLDPIKAAEELRIYQKKIIQANAIIAIARDLVSIDGNHDTLNLLDAAVSEYDSPVK